MYVYNVIVYFSETEKKNQFVMCKKENEKKLDIFGYFFVMY